MKKRKLLETLKELIESNAQLSAENQELRALVNNRPTTPCVEAETEQSQTADKDYEKLESDNRILSQELIEAKAKILELSKQLESDSETENEQNPAEDSSKNEEVTDMGSTEETPEASEETLQDDGVGLFVCPPLSTDIDSEEPELCEPDYIVKPEFNIDIPPVVAEEIATPVSKPYDDITDWQIDMASEYIGKAIIMITEFNNEIADSSSQNKQDLVTLALGKSEAFKSEIVDAISACNTPESAEATADKRIDELKRYINALRLSL